MTNDTISSLLVGWSIVTGPIPIKAPVATEGLFKLECWSLIEYFISLKIDTMVRIDINIKTIINNSIKNLFFI